ncbi:hypothetical protein PMAYCL1PPCAC_31071, partial [Pristionchus mayeri]
WRSSTKSKLSTETSSSRSSACSTPISSSESSAVLTRRFTLLSTYSQWRLAWCAPSTCDSRTSSRSLSPSGRFSPSLHDSSLSLLTRPGEPILRTSRDSSPSGRDVRHSLPTLLLLSLPTSCLFRDSRWIRTVLGNRRRGIQATNLFSSEDSKIRADAPRSRHHSHSDAHAQKHAPGYMVPNIVLPRRASPSPLHLIARASRVVPLHEEQSKESDS